MGWGRANFLKTGSSPLALQEHPERLDQLPVLAMQAVLIPGSESTDGRLIAAVAFPWFEIVRLIQKEPERIHEIGWRKWEELVAGAYRAQGFEVVLTPSSGDGGRDVIASKGGVGAIRILDQVKAYKPGHLVTAEEVRAMLGVLTAEGNASKGVVTTTSSFAPGIEKDPRLASLMPYRLELKPRDVLLPWLVEVSARSGPS